MSVALLATRCLLAAVFAVAAIAKLAEPRAARQAAYDLGLPRRLAAPLALLLPPVELVVAIGLLPRASARAAAGAGAALLVLFAIALSVAVARGRRPGCHCFGRLSSAQAGPGAITRNGVLAAGAAAVAAAGPGRPLGAVLAGVDPSTAALAALALGLAAQAWFAWHLLRQNGRLLVRVRTLEEAIGAGPAAATPEPPRVVAVR